MALQLYRVISLTLAQQLYQTNYWSKGKFLHKNNSLNPRRLVWNKNEAIDLLLY